MMLASRSSSPSSRSIPINNNTSQSRRMARADEAFEREVAMADYVDFCFATRLVHGMQKRQSMTHDVSLRYENQALIDHIIATRQNLFLHHQQQNDEATTSAFFPTIGSRNYHRTTHERRDSNEKLRNARSFHEEKDKDGEQYEDQIDDDDMIFDMEL